MAAALAIAVCVIAVGARCVHGARLYLPSGEKSWQSCCSSNNCVVCRSPSLGDKAPELSCHTNMRLSWHSELFDHCITEHMEVGLGDRWASSVRQDLAFLSSAEGECPSNRKCTIIAPKVPEGSKV
eukprot:708272-Amphidinium_carterae.1